MEILSEVEGRYAVTLRCDLHCKILRPCECARPFILFLSFTDGKKRSENCAEKSYKTNRTTRVRFDGVCYVFFSKCSRGELIKRSPTQAHTKSIE